MDSNYYNVLHMHILTPMQFAPVDNFTIHILYQAHELLGEGYRRVGIGYKITEK